MKNLLFFKICCRHTAYWAYVIFRQFVFFQDETTDFTNISHVKSILIDFFKHVSSCAAHWTFEVFWEFIELFSYKST